MQGASQAHPANAMLGMYDHASFATMSRVSLHLSWKQIGESDTCSDARPCAHGEFTLNESASDVMLPDMTLHLYLGSGSTHNNGSFILYS
jgi:hypothetical protein